ncbi:hypothetical protein LCL96_06390 [Rossellomorea aquimaris]|uniref:hypothetical protein n=1 Tax=Rossellomorea aquimaris TaxID=189382 RepID=UPI001CD50A4B|nr:hypothetical protein [Rossellomorea aquimaris]MCA1058555.1 hypothetical protein [Rossellomorea aquimaris]
MNKTALLTGLRWGFIFLVAFVIFVYSYKRVMLHSGIESAIHKVAPQATIVGIIQTHTTTSKNKIYRALYKTTEGKCFNASFKREDYTILENQESTCQ